MKWGGQKLDWPCTQHGSREISWKDQYSRRGQRKMMKKTNVVVIAALCEHGSLALAGLQTGGDANSIFNPQRKSVCAVDRRDISTWRLWSLMQYQKKKITDDSCRRKTVEEVMKKHKWRYGEAGPEQSFAIKMSRLFFFFLPQREINQWTFECTAAPANEGRIINSHLELVLLTNSQQIKTCTVTDYWHFRWVVEGERVALQPVS